MSAFEMKATIGMTTTPSVATVETGAAPQQPNTTANTSTVTASEPIMGAIVAADIKTPSKGTATADVQAAEKAKAKAKATLAAGSPRLLGITAIISAVICGLIYGMAPGIIGIYLPFYGTQMNCNGYLDSTGCLNAHKANCQWVAVDPAAPTDFSCQFDDWQTVTCFGHTTMETCEAESKACVFDVPKGVCYHAAGLDAAQSGGYAASSIVGGCVLPYFMDRVRARFGLFTAYAVCAVLLLVANVLNTVAVEIDSLGMHVVGRLIYSGVAFTLNAFAMVFASTVAPDWMGGAGGATNLAIEFVFLSLGVYGYVAFPKDLTHDPHMRMKLQGLHLFQWIYTAFLIMFLPFMWYIMRRRAAFDKKRAAAQALLDKCHHDEQVALAIAGGATQEAALATVAAEAAAAKVTPKEGTLRELLTNYKMPLLRAVLYAATSNVCGLAAVGGYGPAIVSTLGIDSMLGNMIFGITYFVGAMLSIPAALFVPFKVRAHGNGFGMGIAIVIAGIAILPGVDVGSLSFAMFLLYILVFAIGYNTSFFYLALKFFPPHLEGVGSGIAFMVNAGVSVIVSGCFPNGVQSISGGKSGDVRVGRGVSFIVMGSVTLGMSAVISLIFKTWAQVEEEEADRARQPDAIQA